jgi:sorbitol/mannitol transport system substrate-binding protein
VQAKRALMALGIAAAAAVPAAGCSWAGAGGGSGAVRVLMVNNPQQVELQALTAKYITARTGIKVDFKVLPEDDLRDAMNEDVANQAGQYDVVSTSNFETPFYAKYHWLKPLDAYIRKDPGFDVNDILGPMRESLQGPGGSRCRCIPPGSRSRRWRPRSAASRGCAGSACAASRAGASCSRP